MNWKDFQGVNRGYVLELYERFRNDPHSVDPDTRMFLEKLGPPEPLESAGPAGNQAATAAGDLPAMRVVGAINLAQSIRRYGHLAARIDPLGTEPIGDPLLDVSTHQITESDLRALPPTLVDSALTSGAS